MLSLYMPRNRTKVAVIFDLDETIGHFYQVGKIWEGLKVFQDKKFSERDFHKLLDLFPYVFRPGIFKIFKFLKSQKIRDRKIKVIIYSNNQGTPKWGMMIKKYIEKKINYKLFDKVITAWKVNGIIYEKCRTTNEKTYKEIVRCGKLNKETKIFFIDDAYHPKMFHENVDYFHIKEWKFAYNIENMVKKFLSSKCCEKLNKKSVEELETKLPTYVKRLDWGYIRYTNKDKPSRKEQDIGLLLHKEIRNFLKINNNNTRRVKLRRTGTRRK